MPHATKRTHPGPRPRRPPARRPSPREILAGEVLARMATMATTTPDRGELARALGWSPEVLAPILARLERTGLVEGWHDPHRPGACRVMLSARSLARLGLSLSPRGDRWDPDRPPSRVGRR